MTGIDARAIVRSLAKRVTHSSIELLIGASLDARDNIDSFENVQDFVALVHDRNTTDVLVDHQADSVEDRSHHAGGHEVVVRAQTNLPDALLEKHRVVLVVHSDELEDAILCND